MEKIEDLSQYERKCPHTGVLTSIVDSVDKGLKRDYSCIFSIDKVETLIYLLVEYGTILEKICNAKNILIKKKNGEDTLTTG